MPNCLRPIASAAASERSRIRYLIKGPRSLIRTSTDFPVRRKVTWTRVPKGRSGDAAVSSFESNRRPLLVLLPWCCLLYQDAIPITPCFGVRACTEVAANSTKVPIVSRRIISRGTPRIDEPNLIEFEMPKTGFHARLHHRTHRDGCQDPFRRQIYVGVVVLVNRDRQHPQFVIGD